MATGSEGRVVIVTSEHRGVFCGALESYDEDKRVAVLTDARMAIRWATTRGLLQLAQTGPTKEGKVSDLAPRIRLEKCTAIIECAPDAVEAWKRCK